MLKQSLLADFKRYNLMAITFKNLMVVFIIDPIPGLKFMFIFRIVQYYRRRNRMLFLFFYLWLRRLKVKYGLDISYRAQIGNGFYIGHFGQVVIHGDAIIGENCNISQGITIGIHNYGDKKGIPIIGNHVFLGPNACIFGNITIGNNVVVGANVVLTENVPEGKTIVAPKNEIIDKDLSEYYIPTSKF